MALWPAIESVTKPLLRELDTRATSMMPVIGRLLLPGTRVMSLMVELPTTPLVVERIRVTLPWNRVRINCGIEVKKCLPGLR